MTLYHALFLGVLQGLTEFLPISSSGHLVLAELLLDIHITPEDMQSMNVMLHAGTLLALLMIYSGTWINLAMAPIRNDTRHSLQLVLLVIATIPGALFGFLFEDVIANHFQVLLCIGMAFALTGFVLLLSEVAPHRKQTIWRRRKLTTRSAVFIGLAQALALVPGLSRSGLTISAGRMMGLERKDALDFSFLMAVPIIAGASAITLLDVFMGEVTLPPLHITLVAIVTSFLVSVISILWLRKFVVHRSLAWFSPYLFAVAGLTIALSLQ